MTATETILVGNTLAITTLLGSK